MEPKFKPGDWVRIEKDPRGAWEEEHGEIVRHLGGGLYEVSAWGRDTVAGHYREWDETQMLPDFNPHERRRMFAIISCVNTDPQRSEDMLGDLLVELSARGFSVEEVVQMREEIQNIIDRTGGPS